MPPETNTLQVARALREEPSHTPIWMVPLIIGLAVGVQVAFVLESHRSVMFQIPVVDAASYLNQATALAQGQTPDPKPFWQPPLYVYGLRLLLKTGTSNILTLRMIQAAFGVMIAWLTFLVARTCAGTRVAFGTSLAVIFSGPLLFFSTQLLPTGPAVALDMAVLWSWLHVMRRPGWGWGLITGLALGLAALLVSNILIVLPVMLGWLLWSLRTPTDRPRRIEAGLALIAAVALVIAPVTLRNYIVSGQLVPISTNAGINLYIGNNPDRSDTIAIRPGLDWERLVARPYRHGARDDSEAQAYFLAHVRDFARSHPVDFVGAMFTKALQTLNSREIPRNVDLYAFRPHSAMLRVLAWKRGSFCFPFGLIMPLALWGMVIAWRGNAHHRTLTVYALLYGASVILFFPASRYLAPILPVLLILAGIGIEHLMRPSTVVHERLFAIMCCGAMGLLLNLPIELPTDQIDFVSDLETNVGVGLQTRGRLDEAIMHYRAAIARDPSHADAYRFLGTAYRESGHKTAARWNLEKALALRPDHEHAMQDLAVMAFTEGHTEKAVQMLRDVLALNPDNQHAMVNLGVGLLKLNRRDEAQQWFTRAGVMHPYGL